MAELLVLLTIGYFHGVPCAYPLPYGFRKLPHLLAICPQPYTSLLPYVITSAWDPEGINVSTSV